MGKKRTKNIEGGLRERKDRKVRKASKKQVIKGIANIFASYNNTIVSIADQRGDVFVWSTASLIGFKGTRKSTPYAATLVAKDAGEKAKQFGLMEVVVVVKGIGPGREAAIRGLMGTGVNITEIKDNTPLAHNGVRPPKPRRV